MFDVTTIISFILQYGGFLMLIMVPWADIKHTDQFLRIFLNLLKEVMG